MLSRRSQTIPRQVADTERVKSGAGLSRPRGDWMHIGQSQTVLRGGTGRSRGAMAATGARQGPQTTVEGDKATKRGP